LAVTPFVPILNGKTTGELKLVNDDHSVSDIAWNEGGEYYIEMLLSMVENGHGQRALYLYTNGADIDENNVPKHDINNATTSIPFGAFKKTDEAE
jgi:hypothetical protein